MTRHAEMRSEARRRLAKHEYPRDADKKAVELVHAHAHAEVFTSHAAIQ